jgi:hypothetical protein
VSLTLALVSLTRADGRLLSVGGKESKKIKPPVPLEQGKKNKKQKKTQKLFFSSFLR